MAHNCWFVGFGLCQVPLITYNWSVRHGGCLRDRRSHPEGGCSYGSGASGRTSSAGTIFGVRWDDTRYVNQGGAARAQPRSVSTLDSESKRLLIFAANSLCARAMHRPATIITAHGLDSLLANAKMPTLDTVKERYPELSLANQQEMLSRALQQYHSGASRTHAAREPCTPASNPHAHRVHVRPLATLAPSYPPVPPHAAHVRSVHVAGSFA